MFRINCIIPTSGRSNSIHLLKKVISSVQKASDKIATVKFFIVSSNPSVVNLLKVLNINYIFLISKSEGFSVANNTGIQGGITKFPSDYYLFINDDAWVKKSFFANFKRTISDSIPDIVCPLIYDSEGKIQSFGTEYFSSGFARNNTSLSLQSKIFPATCIFIKTKFLIRLKNAYGYYFNTLLDSYYEDTELSIRAMGIGANMFVTTDLQVFHIGSFSYGLQSKIVMYYTFRNILWVIGMTWPTKVILKNIGYVLLVQIWFFICSIRAHHWWIYPKILFHTLKSFRQLKEFRGVIVKRYRQNFNFDTVFSPYWFRLNKSDIALKGF